MKKTENISGAVWLGTVALVTLVRSSDEDTIPAGELIEKIRTAIQSSEISNMWTIEKISILGSKIDAEIAPKILGESELLAAGMSPATTKKTP